eukprot:scaffold1245_cov109-Cylindrotheca_fusiformis.AAC.1
MRSTTFLRGYNTMRDFIKILRTILSNIGKHHSASSWAQGEQKRLAIEASVELDTRMKHASVKETVSRRRFDLIVELMMKTFILR